MESMSLLSVQKINKIQPMIGCSDSIF